MTKSKHSSSCQQPGTEPARSGWVGYIVAEINHSLARVWYWQAQDLITRACAFMPRNLIREEWKQSIGEALAYEAAFEKLPIESEVTPMP